MTAPLLRSSSGTDETGGASVSTDDLASLLAAPIDSIETARVDQIGRYSIERLLGKGSGGLVYLGLDPKLGRRVAIKLLRRAGSTDRLAREARLLASINHPAIATVYSFDDAGNGVAMLVTEYIRGGTLANRLREGLSLREALRISAAAASAVEASHQKLVLHCDIKPANILLTETGAVKVVDFGLARMLSEDPGRAEGGTPGYASPEQAAGLTVGPAADVFSLGCVIFECLAGKPAFDSEAGLGVTATAAPDWSLVPPEVPASICNALRHALEPDPKNRRISAGDLRMVLERAQTAPDAAGSTGGSNLPPEFTTFIGRTTILRELQAQVPACRLVALVGTGGCGKSRLACAVSRQVLPSFNGGTWFVELATCRNDADVLAAIASVLGVHEQPGRALESLITTRLNTGRTLLILDNCEHLLSVCAAVVTSILGACSGVHVLVTSREALGVLGERVFHVPSLSLADHGGRSEAVELFIDRALLVRPGFEAEGNRAFVESICITLDGIPLAIELAAARLRHTTARDLAQAVKERYRTLNSGNRTALPRHQTLRGLVDWSYSLLFEQERALFRRLSVFAGGWSLRAAEAVQLGSGDTPSRSVPDLLVALANKSLLVFEELEGDARFRMLETLREFASDRLTDEAGEELEWLRSSHARYFLTLAEAANTRLTGADQARVINELKAEHDNLRGALRYFSGMRGCATEFLRLATSLTQFWCMCGFVNEARAWLSDAFRAADEAPDEVRAPGANCLGILGWIAGDQRGAIGLYETSAALYARVGNLSRVAAVTSNLAAAYADIGEAGCASAAHARAIGVYEALRDRVGVARGQLNYSVFLTQSGEFEEARRLVEACLPVFEEVGDHHRIAAAIHNRGHVLFALKQYDAASECFARCHKAREQLDDRIGVALDVLWLGLCDAVKGHYLDAVRQLTRAERLRTQTGATLSRVDQAQLELTQSTLKKMLGDERFEVEWKQGIQASAAIR